MKTNKQTFVQYLLSLFYQTFLDTKTTAVGRTDKKHYSQEVFILKRQKISKL